MSDRQPNRNELGQGRRPTRDQGFSLPELLIAIAILGIITAVLSAAIIVVIRQQDSTVGRLDGARAEQSFDTWMPADLASFDPTTVTTDPTADPCSAPCNGIDISGVNTLLASWSVDAVTVTVSYQYIAVGDEWQLQRIECGPSGCRMNVVLHDMVPPPALPYPPSPGPIPEPIWAIRVTPPPAGTALTQVSVFVDSGGSVAEGGGVDAAGITEIKLSADGVTPSTVLPTAGGGPSFVRAISDCGGPMSIIIDSSGSIGATAMGQVRTAVSDVIESFRGTPVQLQIIDFDGEANVLSGTSAWTHYYDMTDDGQVDALKALVASISAGGSTNWEDAWFRALLKQDGTPQNVKPNTIVFFTDGVPSWSRVNQRGDGGVLPADPVKYPAVAPYNWPAATGNGSILHQESFDRTEYLIQNEAAGIRIVGVAVGPNIGNSYNWTQVADPYNNGPAPAISKTGAVIVKDLVSTIEPAIEAVPVNGPYTNSDTARFYQASDFSYFDEALRAAALNECGGTLTLQTRVNGTPANDEFVYENSETRDATNTPTGDPTRTVTTSSLYRTGTFDFDIAGALPYHVDVIPQSLQTLEGFNPVGGAGGSGWTCRAGSTDLTGSVTVQAIPSSSFFKFTVDVAPNQAVSCTLNLTPA